METVGGRVRHCADPSPDDNRYLEFQLWQEGVRATSNRRGARRPQGQGIHPRRFDACRITSPMPTWRTASAATSTDSSRS